MARYGGRWPYRTANAVGRLIEGLEQWHSEGAAAEHVNRPAVLRFRGLPLVFARIAVDVVEAPEFLVRQRRHERLIDRPPIEPAGSFEEPIPDCLRLHPPARKAGEENVFGIFRHRGRFSLAALTVRAAVHDRAVETFQAIAPIPQVGGQPVEQCAMGGRCPLGAEVVGGGDDPPAKVPLPDSVGDHARRERMVRGGDPLCQTGPGLSWILLAGGKKRAPLRQEDRRRGEYPSGRLVQFTAPKQMHAHRLGGVAERPEVRLLAVDPGDVAGGAVEGFRTGEDRLEAEVIALAERIVFVVMAVGAAHREAQHRFAERHHLIVAPHVGELVREGIEGIGPLAERPHGHRIGHPFRLLGP